jgi:crotonobetainyl-CoA:carnitine CoA-transferase CaiB-like acyl-CoA transferase
MRIGYGDDAAVAGGLAVSDERGPMFVADAVADPITGLLGAVAVLDRLQRGGRWLIDAALTRAAAAAAGEAGDIEVEPTAHPPRHRPARGTAPGFGEHTEAVLRELVE